MPRKKKQDAAEKKISIEDYIEEYEFEEEKEETTDEEKVVIKEERKYIKILNIIFIIILIIIALVTADIICVTKYEKGPVFAIPLHTYDDGGTKEYYGIGYKVIKYKQVQGRRDIEIGTWSLEYNVEPIRTEALDLAIEFEEDETAAYKKYNKKFLYISGELTNINEVDNKIVVSFIDEDGKYSIDIECSMETDKQELQELELNKQITVIGSMKSYSYETDEEVGTLHLKYCFAEQE